ncbi:MAG: tRNA(m5U54)methyltransferase [Heterodermia speciosa]|uniref:tRNA(M5U54)methyltransferase n=1 Tax=Heterodermia speciosa TaxID=116794 RepID=A0A8H3I6T7_9LECA|nr:MAG: tRNA(m5U54)methyltransferase [Heterodermia speciosa]
MAKRKFQNGYPVKRQKTKPTAVKEGSNEEVLLMDIRHLLSTQILADKSENGDASEQNSPKPGPSFSPPERFSDVEVLITEFSSSGDGLGLAPTADHVYVVPFSIPGDLVKAKVINYFPQDRYTLTDFISVIKPAANRNDSLVQCPYFAKCSGCQFQMLSYEEQLAQKKRIVEKAYQNFSSLPPELIPVIGDTIGSPLQYGYRTKLTPHFDGPPGTLSRKARRANAEVKWDGIPPIGFLQKGTRKTVDIEDCPIGTDTVRLGMKQERERVADEIALFRRGATLLLRESTKRTPKPKGGLLIPASSKAEQKSVDIAAERPQTSVNGVIPPKSQPLVQPQESDDKPDLSLPYTEEKTCITDQNATSTEFVDNYIFSNPAGSFFQNNNSILSVFTAYIRANILPPSSTALHNPNSTPAPSHSSPTAAPPAEKPITNLIDAYCGSGLFSITLSPLFTHTLGIDIARASINSAHANALANDISNAEFISADATALFASVAFPPDETVVVIDPPRKGCDEGFLRQLLEYAPRRVVYVSCNVHTQARDVGFLVEGVRGEEGKEGGRVGARYEIESLRGFDFFPQTAHVEGVAVLRRVVEG